MAYSKPEQWTHGDIPNAAKMNKYSDSLTYLHGLQTVILNWPCERAPGSENWYMQHRYRWLAYDDNGAIEDPSGIGETVSLSDPGSGVYFYDLDAIDWLTPGAIYRLTGFDWVIEVEVPG